MRGVDLQDRRYIKKNKVDTSVSLQPPPPVTSGSLQAEPGVEAGLEAGTGPPEWGPPQTHGILTPGSRLASASMAQTVPAAKAHTFRLEQLPSAQAGRWGRWGRQAVRAGGCHPWAFPPP